MSEAIDVPNNEWRQRMLEHIPDAILIGPKRKSLVPWCRNRHFYPTLLEIDQERTRRKANQ